MSCALACGREAQVAVPLVISELAGELIPDSRGNPLLDPICVDAELRSELTIWLFFFFVLIRLLPTLVRLVGLLQIASNIIVLARIADSLALPCSAARDDLTLLVL